MLRNKRKVLLVLAVMLVVLLAACSMASPKETVSEKGSVEALESKENVLVASSNEEKLKEVYELNKSRTFVVGKVVYHSFPEGWDNKGCCAEGFPQEGIKSTQIRLDAYEYYNYARLWNTAEADEDASYCYFKIGLFNWNGGKYRDAVNSNRSNPDTFNGLITNKYVEYLKEQNQSIEFIFDIDWEHQHMADEGEIVILSADSQLTYNPNYFIDEMKDRIAFPKMYSAVVAPFSTEHPTPYIAKFVDGKLQLPAELQDAFALRRLYDDTEPQLTGINDGDSVEDVVAFLKAVEQDMARYEEEMRQQPIQADRS